VYGEHRRFVGNCARFIIVRWRVGGFWALCPSRIAGAGKRWTTRCAQSLLYVSMVADAGRRRPSGWRNSLKTFGLQQISTTERFLAFAGSAGISRVPRPNRLHNTGDQMPLSLGQTVRVLRSAKGFSQQKLAKSAKISKPYLSLIESDKRQPTPTVLDALSRALGVPTIFLIRQSMSPSKRSELGPQVGIEKRLNQTLDCMEELEEKLRKLSCREPNEAI